MYRRFLNNEDYLSILTKEALYQLIRDNENRLSQAEEMAEMSMIEYLTDNYEIEQVLEEGKCLLEYNRQISYPAGAHFYFEGKLYQAMRTINGVKRPMDKVYWKELEEYDEARFNIAKPYFQMKNYSIGDIVKFAGSYFECESYNGIDFNDIRVPGIDAWVRVEVGEWEPNVPYDKWKVVSYEGKYYALIDMEDLNQTINPHDSDNWGLIGDYVEDYQYELNDHEYVVFNGEVYYPEMNPNNDLLKREFNIRLHDPRNANVKKHMLRLAVYELHKLISPNNVSNARVMDYEATIMWLRDANRCKITPQIPRKLDHEDKPVAEYAIATFMKDYDPYKNPWQI